MGKYIKLFGTHPEYSTYINSDEALLPNVSLCNNVNEVHYNPVKYYITPKMLVEFIHSFIKSTYEKFFEHMKEHMDIDKESYATMCENKISKSFQKLNQDTYKEYGGMLRYRNITIGPETCDLTFSAFLFGEIFNLNLNMYVEGPTLKFSFNNKDVNCTTFLYKTDKTYNGNDIFYINYVEISDEEEIEDEIINLALYGDKMVLLCPHDTYADFTIAYTNGNGGYTTTKPSSITITPSIVENSFSINPEWISLTIMHNYSESVTERVDEAISTLRDNWRSWFNGDFSELSVLDDVVMEKPEIINEVIEDGIKMKMEKDIYTIIKNPWTYLDEEYIFNGEVE